MLALGPKVTKKSCLFPILSFFLRISSLLNVFLYQCICFFFWVMHDTVIMFNFTVIWLMNQIITWLRHDIIIPKFSDAIEIPWCYLQYISVTVREKCETFPRETNLIAALYVFYYKQNLEVILGIKFPLQESWPWKVHRCLKRPFLLLGYWSFCCIILVWRHSSFHLTNSSIAYYDRLIITNSFLLSEINLLINCL